MQNHVAEISVNRRRALHGFLVRRRSCAPAPSFRHAREFAGHSHGSEGGVINAVGGVRNSRQPRAQYILSRMGIEPWIRITGTFFTYNIQTLPDDHLTQQSGQYASINSEHRRA